MHIRWRAAVPAAVLVALAMSGTASAKTYKAKGPLQVVPSECGANDPALPRVGKVTFKRVGEAITLKVVLKHGLPNKEYQVFLQREAPNEKGEPSCRGKFLGDFFSDAHGNGRYEGTESRPLAETRFFAEVISNPFQPGYQDSWTPWVSLP